MKCFFLAGQKPKFQTNNKLNTQKKNMNLSQFPREIVILIKDFVFRRIRKIPKDDCRYIRLSPVYQKRAKTNVWLCPIILEGRVVVYPLVPNYNYWTDPYADEWDNSHAIELRWESPQRLFVPEPVWNWAGTRHLDIVQENPDKPWNYTFSSENPNITWDMVQADDGHEEEEEEAREACFSRPLTTSYLGNAFRRRGEEKGPPQLRRMNRQQRRPRRIKY